MFAAAATFGGLGAPTALAAGPTVTINQASGQADPTSGSPINFTVMFSTSVTGFTKGDVVVTSAGGDTLDVAVTALSGTTYTVSLTGMAHSGKVTASVAAGAVTTAGGTSSASTSSDNGVVWQLPPPPTVTINQGAGQVDPTSTSPIEFTATFSEPVSGFTTFDVDLSGSTAGGAVVESVSGGPSVYTVDVSGMTSSGSVIASIPASAATSVATGESSSAATFADHTVAYTSDDTTPPSVTINQATTQADPTSAASIQFTVTFSEAVLGFDKADVALSGTASGAVVQPITGGPSVYTVTVTGMTKAGTVVASVPAHAAHDGTGNDSLASTSTDHTVTWAVPTPTPLPTATPTPPASTGGGTPTATPAATLNATATPTPTPTLTTNTLGFTVTPACTAKQPCATLTGGKALVLTGSCAAGAACSGTVSLSAKVAKSRHAKPKPTTLGQLPFTVAAGASQPLRIPLGATARKLLKKHAHIEITLTISTSPKPTTISITIGLPKKKAKKPSQ